MSGQNGVRGSVTMIQGQIEKIIFFDPTPMKFTLSNS